MMDMFRNLTVVLALLATASCTGPGGALAPSGLQPLTADEQQGSGQLPSPGDDAAANGGLVAPSLPPRVGAGQAAAISTNARVRFAPVIGASAQAVPVLAARLRARAAQRGITVASANDAATAYVMKGYFSAFTDGGETTVIYVWDVLDLSGNRLHRIQGQQKQPGAKGEGWAAVTPPTLEAIADRTIDDLAMWLSAAAG